MIHPSYCNTFMMIINMRDRIRTYTTPKKLYRQCGSNYECTSII